MSNLQRQKMLMARDIPPISPDYLVALTLSCKEPPPTSYLKSFPRFSELPVELRLKIWTQAALDVPGRIIPLRCTCTWPYFLERFHTTSPYPMLATVCYEAREVVATVLPRLFPSPHVDGQQVITVNHEKDILLLASNFTSQHLRAFGEKLGSEKEKIVAVAHEYGNENKSFLTRTFATNSEGAQMFYTFPKLEVFLVVLVVGVVHPKTGVEIGRRASRKAPLKFRAPTRKEEGRENFRIRTCAATRAYLTMQIAYLEGIMAAGNTNLMKKEAPELHFQKLALEEELDCPI